MSNERFPILGRHETQFSPRKLRIVDFYDCKKVASGFSLGFTLNHYELAHFLGIKTIDFLESAFLDTKIERNQHIGDFVTSEIHAAIVQDYFAFREAYIQLRDAGERTITVGMLAKTEKITEEKLADLIRYTPGLRKEFHLGKILPKNAGHVGEPHVHSYDESLVRVKSDEETRRVFLNKYRRAILDLRRIFPNMTANKLTGKILLPFIKNIEKAVSIDAIGAQSFIDNEKDFIAQVFSEKLD